MYIKGRYKLDYIEILQDMLRYIDENIKEKLDVEILSARAGFSPYHFCRVFQWEVGYSIMEYVRNRRLFFAASELTSGRRIVDLALDYGFETHSGFTKAFRRYFGCSPENYRAHSSFDVPKLPILKITKQYVSGGIVMEPKMVKKAAIKVAGFAIKTKAKNGENSKPIPKFWHDFCTDGRQEKLHKESFLKNHDEFGVCFPENPENGEFEYVIGVEVKDNHSIPEGYHVCVIPEALYAVFSSPPADESNFVAAIQGTWKYIFSEWFPTSGYEYANNGIDFELYEEQRINGCDIYIPICKKPA
jgi:AraC family transcriptional regulator